MREIYDSPPTRDDPHSFTPRPNKPLDVRP
jgi:hypothetical protein